MSCNSRILVTSLASQVWDSATFCQSGRLKERRFFSWIEKRKS
nr:MAG TPA: hypothetical protein [Caudoviricetes sp.]